MRLSDFKARARTRARMAHVVRPRRYKRKSKGAIKGFTATQAKSLRRLVAGKEETKYYATQLSINQLIDSAIHTPGTDILPLVPKITQGTDEFQRVGRKVVPSKCRVDVQLSIGDVELGNATVPGLANATSLYVVMYILRSKVFKSWEDYAASDDWNYLLDNGSGGSTPFGFQVAPASGTPFWTTNSSFLQFPIEQSHYTLLRKRVVKLVKNTGTIMGGDGQSTNLAQTTWRGSFSYKLPTLIYDDAKVRVPPRAYPTNTNVMLAVGYVYGNNLNAEQYDATAGQEILPIPPQRVSMTVRNHVWYKDA